MTTTTKAVRATITLGDIELDVFQLPDGKYFLSIMQIAESIGISHKRFAEFRELKLAQTLYPEGFRTAEKSKIEGGTKPVSIISVDDVSKYWTLAAFQTQNAKAMALLAASQAEALERRADAAFGILKTEEEHNIWYGQRADSKLYRRPFTDKLADENARNGNKTNYGLATLRVYKRAKLSEKYKAWKCLPDTTVGFRDTLTVEELATVMRVEDMIVNIMNLRSCTFDDAMEFYKQSFPQ